MDKKSPHHPQQGNRGTSHQHQTPPQQTNHIQGRRQFKPKKDEAPPEPTPQELARKNLDCLATMWEIAEYGPKTVAMRVAGLDPERASQPLLSFTEREREIIHLSLGGFVARLQMLMVCTAAQNLH